MANELNDAVRAALLGMVRKMESHLLNGEPATCSAAYSDEDLCRAGIDRSMAAVLDFHHKQRVSDTQRLCQLDDFSSDVIERAAATLSTIAEELAHVMRPDDKRFLRCHLLTEELSEFMKALLEGDEVEALDALADLLYVLLGSAVTMDLPLAEAFVEVHRSNMTKERQPTDPQGDRVRDKGPNFRPPDLFSVLARHRLEAAQPHVMGTDDDAVCEVCRMPWRQVYEQIDTRTLKCVVPPELVGHV